MTRAAALASLTVLITACASAPPIAQPDIVTLIPAQWAQAAPPSTSADLAPDWWTDFGDPSLDAAVQVALDENRDLRAAVARLEQAAADTRITAADLQPTVQAGFNASRRRQNFIGFPIPGSEDRVLSTTSANLGLSVDTSWELDLWGRLRAGTRAALADLQATGADYRGAQLSLAGQTVKAWFAATEARQQVALAGASVASFRDSSNQVRGRFEQGLRSSLDLRLSLTNLANAEALLQQRRQQLDATERQLAILMGRYASAGLQLPERLPELPPPVPAGLPSALVGRRPDLASAERRVAAATERATVARAALYPRITLTGSTGTASGDLQNLIDPSRTVWSLASSLLQPLFQGGRLRAGVDRADARIDEVLADYTATALQAYAEVESALVAEGLLARRVEFLTTASEHSRAAEQLSEDRYRAGLEPFVTVLESQRLALQAEGELIAARRQHLENRVDLYLALGGGFDQLDAPVRLQRADPVPAGRQGGQ